MTMYGGGSAYLRVLERMNLANVDTGFCTTDSDNKKIKTTITRSTDDETTKNSWNSSSLNKPVDAPRSEEISTRSSYHYPRYQGKYSTRNQTDENSRNSSNTNSQTGSASRTTVTTTSSYPDRYSYRYNYSTASSSNQKPSDNQNNKTSDDSVNHRNNSESKENTSSSLISPTGYLGRYRPKSSSYNLSSETSTSNNQPESTTETTVVKSPPTSYAGYSTRNAYYPPSYSTDSHRVRSSSSEDSSQTPTKSAESKPSSITSPTTYTIGYSYRYPSLSRNTEKGETESREESTVETKEPEVTTTYSYRYPSQSSYTSSNTSITSTPKTQPESSTTSSYSYRYPSRYSTSQDTEEKPASESSSNRYTSSRYSSSQQQPEQTEVKESTTQQSTSSSGIRYPTSYQRYLDRYSSSSSQGTTPKEEESHTEEEPEVFTTTQSYKYPSSYRSSSSTSASQSTKEDIAKDSESDNKTTSYTYRYPSRISRYSSSSRGEESQSQQETETQKEQEVVTTQSYSYRYPSSRYSYTSISSQESAQKTEEKPEESQPEVTTTTYSYRYPSTGFKNLSKQTESESKEDSSKEQEAVVTTSSYSYRYPYSRYSSNKQPEDEVKEQPKESPPVVTTTSYSYRYPSSRYNYSSSQSHDKGSSQTEEESKKEPELVTTTASSYSYRYPSSRYNYSSRQEEPQVEKESSKEPEEVVTTTSYSYRYPSRAYNYSSSTSTTETSTEKTEPPKESSSPVTTSSSYSYRYPYNRYNYSTRTSKEDESKEEESAQNSSPPVTTTHSYRYPTTSSRYTSRTSTQPDSQKDPTEEMTTTTQTYRYPSLSSGYSQSSTTIQTNQRTPEDKEVESSISPQLQTTGSKDSGRESLSYNKFYNHDFKPDTAYPRTSTPVKQTETEDTTYVQSFKQSNLSSNYGLPAISTISSDTTVTETKPTDSRSEERQSTETTGRYTYRYPSRLSSYQSSTVNENIKSVNEEKKETAQNKSADIHTTSSRTVSSRNVSSSSDENRARNLSSSSSTVGSNLQVPQSRLSGSEPLSPALAPRSPGSKHSTNVPKYIFSMGSRTVVHERGSVTSEPEEKKEEVEVEQEAQIESQINEAEVKEEEKEEEKGDPEDAMSSEELLEKGKQWLEELNLAGAERLFLKLYKRLRNNPGDNCNDQLIEIYFGLAEVCTRKSRQRRKTPLEWQWLCVHAAALLAEAAEICEHEAKTEDLESRQLYLTKKEYAENRNKSLEDLLSRTLYNWLNSGWRSLDPMSIMNVTSKGKTQTTSSMFPLSNILGMKPYEKGFLAQALSIESLHELPSSIENESLDSKSNWFKRIQMYCLKRLVNKNRQEVLEEVMKLSRPDPTKNDSQELGSDDEAFEESGEKTEPRKTEGEMPEGMEEGADEDVGDDAGDDIDDAQFEQEKEIVSPLGEKPVKLTIAKIFHRVVGRLIDEQEYVKAELLCEEILQIVEEIQDGTVRMLRFSGQLQQNLGILCLRQGDISKGMSCLEIALNIFRDLQDGIAHREIALVLIDMGNAYVSMSLSTDQLYQAVIAAIREFFEKEACDDNDTGESAPEMIRSKEQDPTNEKEEKRKEDINEAVKCYQEALEVLERNEEAELESIGKALMKLGDCYFIQTEYSKALDVYERAMPIFKKSTMYGKEHFLRNAHVMMMLGVATFMLHVYPRAASIFEIAYAMVKHAHKLETNTVLHGLLLSLMGIACYKIKSYHKCVSMCYQAFEIFWLMHGEGIIKVSEERFWLVCQNLYILGNSYNVLNLQHKAIKYLNIGREFMRVAKIGEKRQFMRILNILGDCYFAQYDYKTALVYYNEALEIGEPPKDEEVVDGAQDAEDEMNQSSEDMALHNQLLSKSAEANISMNQYENAIEYLEQARDMQDVLGEDIKGDLVSTLYQLGQMHSMAGDVDKAIDSYKESLEVFRELHSGNLGPEMCVTLGNLATMCYVKACICEDIDSELQMILAAEGYFQEALKLEMNQSVCVKYANFLYSQGNYDDAIMYLEDAMKTKMELVEIVYGGLEKVTLPEALQDEVDAQEEVAMPSICLGQFLQVLSHKMLGQTKFADRCLLQLMKNVYDTDVPFLRSVLGYAMMEMGLYEEAAISFRAACEMDPEYHLALDNFCLCVCLMALETLNNAVKNIFTYYGFWYEESNVQNFAILDSRW